MLVPERVLKSGKTCPAFQIDDDLAPVILRRKWNVSTEGYIYCGAWHNKRIKYLSLARYVFTLRHGHKPKHEVDHINRDKLDNRSANLRDATRQENNDNRTLPSRVVSLPSCVYFRPADCKARPFVAKVKHLKKDKFLGYFPTVEEAVKARDCYLTSIGRRIPQ